MLLITELHNKNAHNILCPRELNTLHHALRHHYLPIHGLASSVIRSGSCRSWRCNSSTSFNVLSVTSITARFSNRSFSVLRWVSLVRFISIIELISQRRVHGYRLPRLSQSFLSSLSQLLLKQDDILGVAFVGCVRNIADERNKSNDEVNNDIHLHFGLCSGAERWLDLAAGSEHNHGEQHVCHVADGWDQSNYRAPTESQTA